MGPYLCGKETHKFKAILRLQIGSTVLISSPEISPTPLSLQEMWVVVLMMEYFPETKKQRIFHFRVKKKEFCQKMEMKKWICFSSTAFISYILTF